MDEKLILKNVPVYEKVDSWDGMPSVVGHYLSEELAHVDSRQAQQVNPRTDIYQTEDGKYYSVQEFEPHDGVFQDKDRKPDEELLEQIKSKLKPHELKYLNLSD